MQTVSERMQKINKELMWLGGGWFIYGIGLAVGKWLGIYAPTKFDSIFWAAFGGFAVLVKLMADCTEIILRAIQDSIDVRQSDTLIK